MEAAAEAENRAAGTLAVRRRRAEAPLSTVASTARDRLWAKLEAVTDRLYMEWPRIWLPPTLPAPLLLTGG